MAAMGFTWYGQEVSVAIPCAAMKFPIVVYHAPQMKNWRNIIVDSLVRITASRCRDREFLRQFQDNVGSSRQHDVRILRLRGDTRAGDAADHAADDRALLVAAEHPAQHGAG